MGGVIELGVTNSVSIALITHNKSNNSQHNHLIHNFDLTLEHKLIVMPGNGGYKSH